MEEHSMARNSNQQSTVVTRTVYQMFIGLVMLLRDFAAATNPSITDIADAMYVKMITSATGLIIGIISFLGYSYLNTQIDKTVNKMEVASADFIDILQEPTR